MTANSFIAVEAGHSTHHFATSYRDAGELLLGLKILPAFKARGLALLPRFNYPLSILWAHTDSCRHESHNNNRMI